ncbi:MAG TPA: hypothetical protein VHK86_08770 [Nitrososphaera sp.]|nr:hypothetical protein [Nitrososphaera sp.]
MTLMLLTIGSSGLWDWTEFDMDYVRKGQWVVIPMTGQIGVVDAIIQRRLHNKDGKVVVQCGADGPFIKADMGQLREATGIEIKQAEGLVSYE